MIIHDIEQRTEEWFAVRKGLPTASCAGKVITSTGKASTQSALYLLELLAEMYGPEIERPEPTDWMLRGIEMEDEACRALEFEIDNRIQNVGFVTNDAASWGCSPDGLTELYSVEIKCPKPSTHIGYMLKGVLPTGYAPQVHAQMFLTNRDGLFYSHCPPLPALKLIIPRAEYTERVGEAMTKFAEKLQLKKKDLEELL